MSTLFETLIVELERPRELSSQVVRHISGTYDIDQDNVGPFLVNELPKLEDYEIDLILSPVFTPKLADQAVFAEVLGTEAVPPGQWPALVQTLVARPVRSQLVTSDGHVHSVPLRAVSIERYVHRLRLDATIPDSLFKLLNQAAFDADRPMLKAIARRGAWDNDARREILVRYLSTAPAQNAYQLDDAVGLLNLMESYRPPDLADLLARIPRWQQTLREEINVGSGAKPFFSQNIQVMHGGGRDQRRREDARTLAKENEYAFLDRLQQVLGDSAA